MLLPKGQGIKLSKIHPSFSISNPPFFPLMVPYDSHSFMEHFNIGTFHVHVEYRLHFLFYFLNICRWVRERSDVELERGRFG